MFMDVHGIHSGFQSEPWSAPGSGESSWAAVVPGGVPHVVPIGPWGWWSGDDFHHRMDDHMA